MNQTEKQVEHSQVDAIGSPPVKSWDDYEQGCLTTFAGGNEGAELGVYRRGMSTVFELLRNEFPPAEQCKAAPDLLEACRFIVSEIENHFSDIELALDESFLESLRDKARNAIAKATP